MIYCTLGETVRVNILFYFLVSFFYFVYAVSRSSEKENWNRHKLVSARHRQKSELAKKTAISASMHLTASKDVFVQKVFFII